MDACCHNNVVELSLYCGHQKGVQEQQVDSPSTCMGSHGCFPQRQPSGAAAVSSFRLSGWCMLWQWELALACNSSSSSGSGRREQHLLEQRERALAGAVIVAVAVAVVPWYFSSASGAV